MGLKATLEIRKINFIVQKFDFLQLKFIKVDEKY